MFMIRDYFEQNDKIVSGWILSGNERERALREELETFGNSLKPKTIVECIHCNDKFRVNDVVVLRPYKGLHQPMVLCKNYPKCSGSIIDLLPTKSLKKSGNFGGLEFSIIPMSESEIAEMEERRKDLPLLAEGEVPKNGVCYRGF